MFRSPRRLGVSFLKGQIQVAQVEHGSKVQLTALAEGPSSTDFAQSGATLTTGHPQFGVFKNELQTLLKRHKLSGESISFALPADPLFINLIPIDPALKGAKLKEHLTWEMEQYYPDVDPKTFVVGSHLIPSPDGGPTQAFVVGLPKGLVAFVQQAATDLGMKMAIVDVDQFSVEKTVLLNYPEILEHEIVVVGIRYGGVDASLIHEGQMTDYRGYMLDPAADPTQTVEDYLRYLSDRNIPTPAALILHGVDISPALVKSLRDRSGVKQTVALNAVRKLPAMKSIYAPYLKATFRFGAAIGLALRTQ